MAKYMTSDGNEAAAHVAYRVNEVIAIYPITPSSPMGELADQWAAEERKNIWGSVPLVVEMQSEGGASGAVHGSLQRGALTTTFTASQGLLLMIPNMFKIAGELNAAVIHVAARTIATHALSIFCDHSDIMATRSTGFAILSSSSVQEAHDFALISQLASLKTRVPFLHFFDGFRTSHEISKFELIPDGQIKTLIDNKTIIAHRDRALSPDNPFIRGTSQNPDIFFQARESVNPFYDSCPEIVENVMEQFGKLTKREYHLFEYFGSPDAERVIILMGSSQQTVEETVQYLNGKGEKTGVVKVRLYRPFSVSHFLKVIPQTVRKIAVLDRTKEPGSIGEPLYLDVVSAINQEYTAKRAGFRSMPFITGGRYGLSSKEFTPPMVKAVFDELSKDKPQNSFTIGINDDVSGKSLQYDTGVVMEPTDQTRAVFYGYGSDGTVSANKNTLKIIGTETDYFVQGYFVYDSMKAGSVTVSHLRFSHKPIKSSYRIFHSGFVACHQFSFVERIPVLETAQQGATFLLNCPYSVDAVWNELPKTVQKTIIDKKLRVFVIDAYSIAKELGLGNRINTIMQICFLGLSEIMAISVAKEKVKEYIRKSYGRHGDTIVNKNIAAVDQALQHLHELPYPEEITGSIDMKKVVPDDAPEFVKACTSRMIAGQGDELPVSAFDPDGRFPSGTTRYMKRNITGEMPVWDPDVCIQCGRCSLACPHAVVRAKMFPAAMLAGAPQSFRSVPLKRRGYEEYSYSIAVSPDDCTGCRLCVVVCPAKNKTDPKLKALNMQPQPQIRERENENWRFFIALPESDRADLNFNRVQDVQFLEPLFEFSGACAGCGETPYVTLLSRLFGERAIIANATGCSSIYGGNEPATPWAADRQGRGPAWSNSLFEDNAEFGFGFRIAVDKEFDYAKELLQKLAPGIGEELVNSLIEAPRKTEKDISDQRKRLDILRSKLNKIDNPAAKDLFSLCDVFVKKSVWLLGGDGWAYDIGFGGLDHVMALGKDVNILVLDTEVYSNTGGQMSKATPLGAVAKFAARGKRTPKKDLVMMAMTYGSVYVARIALGADGNQALKAFNEAEAFDGSSLIVAYCPCIGQGYNLSNGMEQQKRAVQSGYWPLLRYNPDLRKEGKNPLQLDSSPPSIPLEHYIYNETRYKMLQRSLPGEAAQLLKRASDEVKMRYGWYKYWAAMKMEDGV
ncbi:MAG TPA: pyruvate:ferredoxin (flavodoxin) oxidoreductase [Chitinispirillaceae bacterium]|nr:pyruvate:ferredoxin (flavodoxin) oxidoreductase [Chitinispirillaceae bacterium]